MNLRLIKINQKYEETDMGRYQTFKELNQVLDDLLLETDERLILEVCDENDDIYFEEHLNDHGGLSNKEQYEIEKALSLIQKESKIALDITKYEQAFLKHHYEIILPNFELEDILLKIKGIQPLSLPIGFHYRDDCIICEVIGDTIQERQEDYLEQLQLLGEYLHIL